MKKTIQEVQCRQPLPNVGIYTTYHDRSRTLYYLCGRVYINFITRIEILINIRIILSLEYCVLWTYLGLRMGTRTGSLLNYWQTLSVRSIDGERAKRSEEEAAEEEKPTDSKYLKSMKTMEIVHVRIVSTASTAFSGCCHEVFFSSSKTSRE